MHNPPTRATDAENIPGNAIHGGSEPCALADHLPHAVLIRGPWIGEALGTNTTCQHLAYAHSPQSSRQQSPVSHPLYQQSLTPSPQTGDGAQHPARTGHSRWVARQQICAQEQLWLNQKSEESPCIQLSLRTCFVVGSSGIGVAAVGASAGPRWSYSAALSLLPLVSDFPCFNR